MKPRISLTLTENINRYTTALRLASLDYIHANLLSVKQSLQSTPLFFLLKE